MRVIDELMSADGRRVPHLVELEGPINRRGQWGRAKLYYADAKTHHLRERLDALEDLDPDESPTKERRRARARR